MCTRRRMRVCVCVRLWFSVPDNLSKQTRSKQQPNKRKEKKSTVVHENNEMPSFFFSLVAVDLHTQVALITWIVRRMDATGSAVSTPFRSSSARSEWLICIFFFFLRCESKCHVTLQCRLGKSLGKKRNKKETEVLLEWADRSLQKLVFASSGLASLRLTSLPLCVYICKFSFFSSLFSEWYLTRQCYFFFLILIFFCIWIFFLLNFWRLIESN